MTEAVCSLAAIACLVAGYHLHLGFYWGALLLVTGWLLARLRDADRGTEITGKRWLLPGLILVTCVWLLPDLSTDHHRYLWEGYVQNQGYSPYLHAPVDLFDRFDHPSEPHINHPDLTAVYPPLAQYCFRLANFLTRSPYGWKILLVLSLVPLWFMGGPRGVNRLLLFSPIVLFEGLWNGHLDLLGLAPAIWLLAALDRRLPARTGFLLGCLTALKIIPVMLLPFCFVYFVKREKWIFLAGFAAVVGMCYLPYWDQLPHLFDSFITFSQEWYFNNPFYHVLVASMEAAAARKVLAILLMLALAAAFFYRDDVFWRCTAAWVALYLFSPTLFPWYLLWLVAFTRPQRQAYVHLAYAAAFFSYLVLIPYRAGGIWQEQLFWLIPEWCLMLFCFYRILFPANREE